MLKQHHKVWVSSQQRGLPENKRGTDKEVKIYSIIRRKNIYIPQEFS
jgi:hypothetical protein